MYPPYLTKGRNWTPFRLVKSLSIKIDVDIYEQSENGDRKVTPFLLQNLLEQYKEIAHQIQEIVDLEAED